MSNSTSSTEGVKHTPGRVNTQGGEVAAPLTGAALLKNLYAQGKLTRREVELIAALQDLIAAVEDPDADSLRELIAARAAIAKATGAQP